MNHKQKLGYMALGAGILALGIIIGQVITPDIEAQSNGVFDKITCRELEVVDKDGLTGIKLIALGTTGNGIFVFNKQGEQAIEISVYDETNGINIRSLQGNPGIILGGSTKSNGMAIYSPKGDKESIVLGSMEDRNAIFFTDQAGEQRIVLLQSEGRAPFIHITDRAGNIRWQAP